MAILPSGKRRMSRESQSLQYQPTQTGLEDAGVEQEVATDEPQGPATDFSALQDSLNAPQEQSNVPENFDFNDYSGQTSDLGGFRNQLIDALSQVNVDPERAKLVAKKALTIGYKNPQEDILSGEFLVPAKDDVPITQVKSVFAPIIEQNGFVLTGLKPHQNTGKSGGKVIDYWKLEFETKAEDPNANIEGDYADLIEQNGGIEGGNDRRVAADSQHALIRNSRSGLLDYMIEEMAKRGEL